MRIVIKRNNDDEETDKKEEKEKKPRKKKAEPPKPWGRSERLLIFSLLATTALIAAFLALSARDWKLPGLPKIRLPHLSLEGTYLIEADRPTPPSSDKVITEFKSLTNSLSGNYGFYVIRPHLDQSYGYKHQEIFEAASLIKLPVMFALLREVENENLDLASTYTLTESDKVAGAGSLYYQPAGTTITYEDLITLMGRQSDNTAFHITVKILGQEKITAAISSLGMNRTSLENNETNPRDIGQFFNVLYRGNSLKPEHTQLLIDSLTQTNFEDYLPAGIPADIQVAHKYGREAHVLNDAGLVLADPPYIVVLLSQGIVDAEAEDVFPKLSELIYHFETSQ